ncbi:tyrosine-type recombinase/integrase [Arenimonas sp.]|uniref:tyrosine-type recombinase/integrase n=1 Tax=Arenimonas sp. TaxID=1872635 RepID=UPI0035B3512E
MPKLAKELSAVQVQRLTRPGLHAVGGVAGLLLQVTATGARSWILRVVVGKRRRDLGLGGFPTVSLAQARERAREARSLIWKGLDPVAEKQAQRRALEQVQAIPTFDECARRCLASKRAGFRNAKHAAQWENTLRTYASPYMGQLPVNEVEERHIVNALTPIWEEKNETAVRVRGRIETVIGWATVAGFRTGDNPARWRKHLSELFSAKKKVQHHAALPYAALPGFLKSLRQQAGMAARALEFAILTAARSGEVRGATWDEFDLEAGVWIVPGERMKAGKEHWVPLSAAALTVLRSLPRTSDRVFPSPTGRALSDMALSAVLKRMEVEVTVHGMRSTFRDWAGETTAFDRETIEHALAHRLKDKAEAAYARGSHFDKRRKLMEAWATYCTTEPAADGAKVTPIRKKSGTRR